MNNLTGNDVLILHYINKNSSASELKQTFWKEYYNNDNEKSIQRLIENDYLELKQDEYISLNRLTLDELKNILRKDNLKLSGKKSELIERIIKESSKENYQDYLQLERCITDKGKELINNTGFILVMHDFRTLTSPTPNVLYRFYLDNKEYSEIDMLSKYIDSSNSEPFELYQFSEVCSHYNDTYKEQFYKVKALYKFITTFDMFYPYETFDYFTDKVFFYLKDIKKDKNLNNITNELMLLFEGSNWIEGIILANKQERIRILKDYYNLKYELSEQLYKANNTHENKQGFITKIKSFFN